MEKFATKRLVFMYAMSLPGTADLFSIINLVCLTSAILLS